MRFLRPKQLLSITIKGNGYNIRVSGTRIIYIINHCSEPAYRVMSRSQEGRSTDIRYTVQNDRIPSRRELLAPGLEP